MSGTDLGKGTKKCHQLGRPPRTQWPPSILTGRSVEPPRLFLELAAPAKLSNQGRRAFVREEMGEPSRRTTISAALHQSGLYGRVAIRKTLLSKRNMTAHLEFDKRHLKTLRP